MEFWKGGDSRIIPGALPVVYYTTEARLNEMIDYCREIGVFVANPTSTTWKAVAATPGQRSNFSQSNKYDRRAC